MTIEALRRRRPEALADLLAMYGKEIQGVAWIIHASLQFPDGDAQVYWHLIVEP
jgi:hypothetical protein